MYDVVIVGGGAAGLTAAIYTGRKKLKTLVVVGPHPGGETTLTNDIRNYPGYEEGPGTNLMKVFEKQAKTWGAEFKDDLVETVTKQGTTFSIKLMSGTTVEAKTVILSYGRKRRKLNIPGEEEWMGRGVSTCTTCDAPLFGDKTVAVIGGGNAAVEGALDAATYATTIHLIHRRKDFRADTVTIDKATNNPKIKINTPYIPVAIAGNKFVTKLTVKNIETGKQEDLAVDGVFIEIGYDADTSMVKGLVDTTPAGEIIVDQHCRTKTPGLYAAGDLTNVPYKQTVISAGMGAIAALEAHAYLTTH